MGARRMVLDLNRGAVDRMLNEVGNQTTKRAADRVAKRARDNLTASGRIGTGKLRDSIKAEKESASGRRVIWVVNVGQPYGKYQERGTASQGSGYIYPVKAKFLRFKPKGSSTFVFARKVRGVKPAWFMRDAYKSIGMRDYLP